MLCRVCFVGLVGIVVVGVGGEGWGRGREVLLVSASLERDSAIGRTRLQLHVAVTGTVDRRRAETTSWNENERGGPGLEKERIKK